MWNTVTDFWAHTLQPQMQKLDHVLRQLVEDKPTFLTEIPLQIRTLLNGAAVLFSFLLAAVIVIELLRGRHKKLLPAGITWCVCAAMIAFVL